MKKVWVLAVLLLFVCFSVKLQWENHISKKQKVFTTVLLLEIFCEQAKSSHGSPSALLTLCA